MFLTRSLLQILSLVRDFRIGKKLSLTILLYILHASDPITATNHLSPSLSFSLAARQETMANLQVKKLPAMLLMFPPPAALEEENREMVSLRFT